MDPDTDSYIDILLPPVTTAERTLGKFRPKTHPKSVKSRPSLSWLPDATQLIPPSLEPPHHAADMKCPEEKSNLPTSSINGSFTNASNLNATRESVNQPEDSQSEPLVSNSDNVVALQCDQGESGEIADMFSSMESLDFSQPPSTNARDGRFQPNAKPQFKGKMLLTSSTAVPDGVKSVGPSTHCSTSSSLETVCSELDLSQEPCYLIEETVDHVGVSMEKAQVSDSDASLQIDPNKSQSEAMTMFSGLESLDDGIVQSGMTAEQAHGKFHPKLHPKTVKQISASCNSADATQLISPTMGSPLHASDVRYPDKGHNLPTISTCGTSTTGACTSGLHVSLKSANQLEASLPEDFVFDSDKKEAPKLDQEKSNGVADMFSSMEFLQDDNHPSLTTGVAESLGAANIHSRGEEVPKQKRAPRKSKRHMTEIEKPVRKRKKASKVPKSTLQEPVKKKFPHGTQRKRRQVNKVLLETPEEEIDRKQLSFKDLIMLAEAKERISYSEAASLRKSSLKQKYESNSSLNFDGNESNQNIELSSTKLNYHSMMKRETTKWSKSETELFYEAIRQFGTDFTIIQQLFPKKSRNQIKLKFKKRDLDHSTQVDAALIHRSKDHFLSELVIQKLQEEAEQNAYKEENDDPAAISLDAVSLNEAQYIC